MSQADIHAINMKLRAGKFELRARIYELLKANPGITAYQMAPLAGCSNDTAYENLFCLVNEEWARRSKIHKMHHYFAEKDEPYLPPKFDFIRQEAKIEKQAQNMVGLPPKLMLMMGYNPRAFA